MKTLDGIIKNKYKKYLLRGKYDKFLMGTRLPKEIKLQMLNELFPSVNEQLLMYYFSKYEKYRNVIQFTKEDIKVLLCNDIKDITDYHNILLKFPKKSLSLMEILYEEGHIDKLINNRYYFIDGYNDYLNILLSKYPSLINNIDKKTPELIETAMKNGFIPTLDDIKKYPEYLNNKELFYKVVRINPSLISKLDSIDSNIVNILNEERYIPTYNEISKHQVLREDSNLLKKCIQNDESNWIYENTYNIELYLKQINEEIRRIDNKIEILKKQMINPNKDITSVLLNEIEKYDNYNIGYECIIYDLEENKKLLIKSMQALSLSEDEYKEKYKIDKNKYIIPKKYLLIELKKYFSRSRKELSLIDINIINDIYTYFNANGKHLKSVGEELQSIYENKNHILCVAGHREEEKFNNKQELEEYSKSYFEKGLFCLYKNDLSRIMYYQSMNYLETPFSSFIGYSYGGDGAVIVASIPTSSIYPNNADVEPIFKVEDDVNILDTNYIYGSFYSGESNIELVHNPYYGKGIVGLHQYNSTISNDIVDVNKAKHHI